MEGERWGGGVEERGSGGGGGGEEGRRKMIHDLKFYSKKPLLKTATETGVKNPTCDIRYPKD